MALPIPENPPLNLQDSSRWQLRESVNLSSTIAEDGAYNRIPEYFFSFSFASPILAIQALSFANLGNKKKVGRILQTTEAGIQGGVPVILTARNIWLGISLLKFAQDLNQTYKLRFLAGLYIPEISILLYEYL